MRSATVPLAPAPIGVLSQVLLSASGFLVLREQVFYTSWCDRTPNEEDQDDLADLEAEGAATAICETPLPYCRWCHVVLQLVDGVWCDNWGDERCGRLGLSGEDAAHKPAGVA